MDPLVDTLAEDPRWDALGLDRLAEDAARATLVRLGLEPAAYEISCLGCNDARISDLNADFRGKPQPTNVLSWPSAERAARRPGAMPRPPGRLSTGPLALGDIALAWETIEAEARAAGIAMDAHAAHLIVHGTLHLLGFDHEHEADAVLMEGLEAEILTGLGIAGPLDADANGRPDGEPLEGRADV